MFEKYLREAAMLPVYDAGNFGMQRRRVHGVFAHAGFNPRALMEDDPVNFTKEIETVDTMPAALSAAAGTGA
jgi:nitroalkane oxidase